ncbi:MAG: class III poly(R)-hydroxyalkanoic acid synthase subunit PhaE [Gammaproteobacteria bacterium]
MGGSSGTFSHDDWKRFWDHALEQAWGAWRAYFDSASASSRSDPHRLWQIWSEGLERLWQGQAPALHGTSQEVFNRLLDQGKGFFFLSFRMLQAFEQMERVAEQGGEWKPVLRKAIDEAQEQLRQWSGASVGQAALWGLPAEMWERLAASLALAPGYWEKMFSGGGRNETDLRNQGGALSEWPALGATREWQLHWKEGLSRSEAWREAWQRYAAKLVEVGVLALDYLYERLVEAGETGRPLTTLRQLYDLWVDCAEEAHAEIAGTPDFGRIQADVINKAVALKRHLQQTVEQTAKACDLPTRSEMDAAHRAIKELREALFSLREEAEKGCGARHRGDDK